MNVIQSQFHESIAKTIRRQGKRLLSTGLLLAVGLGLWAQSIDKAKDMLKAGKVADAKTEIDKALAVEKNQKNPEAWYTKVKVYNAIAVNDPLKNQFPDARAQALEALKKYVEVADKDDKKLLLLQLDAYKPVNDIYQGYFQDGASAYNAGNFNGALSDFIWAIKSSDFMTSKGWMTMKIDTTCTLYAGISAEKANKRDTAAIYYSKLVDAGIDTLASANMSQIYKWLVDYYNTAKDGANTKKYLAAGKAKFPNDPFWLGLELENLRTAGGNKDSLFAKYQEITEHFPKNHIYFFNYGVELYQYATDTSTGKRPANSEDLIQKAKTEFAKCLEVNPDYVQAALALGQISYNQGIDLQSQTKLIKGSKPEDIKKRADLRIAAGKKFDEALPYFEKVDQILGSKGKLKMDEKTTLKDTYDLLINIYDQKNLKDKSDAYTTKYNNVDKDH
ncbi:MAG: hypothetical protein P4L51_27280 [Puia sp.]|nr:hypothetical protein [Puia sp.]